MESIALNPPEVSRDHFADRELARRCASGDERALRELFESHEPQLRNLIYRNLGSREDAEELAATTFLRFWRSAHRYRGSCSLRSYLARIALNLCHDAAKRRRPALAPSRESDLPEEHPWAERIRHGLLLLEREDRELLSMYYLDEWEYEEICDSLGITYDVLRTRLVRARKKLRAVVAENDD